MVSQLKPATAIATQLGDMASTAALARPPAQLAATSTLKSVATAAPVSAPAPDAVRCAEEQEPSTIDQLIRRRATQTGCDDPIVGYPSHGTTYDLYSPRQLDAFADNAAAHYASFIPPRTSSDDPVQVIGLLGSSNLNYLASLLAISRLGHTVLFLSTRITQDAYVSLLEATNASTLLIDPNFEHLRSPIIAQLGIQVKSICARGDYDIVQSSSHLPTFVLAPRLDQNREADNTAWIIHSSGSTGQPKPIYQTHRVALRNYSHNFGLRGFITLPLFHAHGISCLFRAIHSRKLIYMYNSDLPLTARHLLTTLNEHTDIQVLYAVPYCLKLLAETVDGIRRLASLDLVMFGGSACPKPIGDKLANNGVLLVSHYGTTETGQLMTSFRERNDVDWDYVRPTPDLLPFLRWEEQSPGIFELCVLEGWPSKVATNRTDGSYATKDLFEKHPTTPNAWRYYARLDDTLVLENGEKANPLLLEGVAKENPNIAEAVVFGANKPRLGVFLIPSETTTYKSDGQLVESIWPAMNKANEFVPGFSRISKDMIKVLPPTATYRKTDKGTVIRAAFYRDLASLIDDAYNEIGYGTAILEGNKLVAHLRQLLLEIAAFPINVSIEDDSDLFSLGVDSLQAIRLRSSIQSSLDVGKEKLTQNFVFENPSITAMAEELTRLRLGQARQQEDPVEVKMMKLIDRYGQFSQHVPVPREDTYHEYMVVTGATGSLGAHIVAELASTANVNQIYCLVRASSAKDAWRRVQQSLETRCVYHTLSLESRSKIIALPSDLSDTQLGLDANTYNSIASSITGLIHCAWSVNFNLALESFEKSCIAGTRHLLDLCLQSRRPVPARFAFCSSVSTVANTPGQLAPEALPPSLLHAQGMGYAQSKLITEHVVSRAAAQTGINARVLRVGQIIADTKHGVWNAQEAIPMIFQTAKTIHALPMLDEAPSWTPVDVVAKSVLELAASESKQVVYNVTNPHTFHWTRDLLPLLGAAGLSFDELSPRDWVRRLRAADQDPNSNPPIKLVDFFARKYDHNYERRKLGYDTRAAERDSVSLSGAGIIDTQFVTRFVKRFEKSCWGSVRDANLVTNVFILCGPCGSGKSTIARGIAATLSAPMVEGDDLHTPECRQRMGANIQMDESDRWGWLDRIQDAVSNTQQSSATRAVVVTCSALRAVYRDELRRLNGVGAFAVRFLLLCNDQSTLEQRTRRRAAEEHHYMKSDLVRSQLALLELPREDETDVTLIDSERDVVKVLEEVLDLVKMTLDR